MKSFLFFFFVSNPEAGVAVVILLLNGWVFAKTKQKMLLFALFFRLIVCSTVDDFIHTLNELPSGCNDVLVCRNKRFEIYLARDDDAAVCRITSVTVLFRSMHISVKRGDAEKPRNGEHRLMAQLPMFLIDVDGRLPICTRSVWDDKVSILFFLSYSNFDY